MTGRLRKAASNWNPAIIISFITLGFTILGVIVGYYIRTEIGMTTIQLQVASNIEATDRNISNLLKITQEQGVRISDMNSIISGLDAEIEIQKAAGFEHWMMIEDLKYKQQKSDEAHKKLLETQAFYFALVERHNEKLIEAGMLSVKPMIP